jgi:hypothetical protein
VKPDIERMEAQLQLWDGRLDQIEAKVQLAGADAGFEVHMYVDELKALCEIARSRLDWLRAGEAPERFRLEAELAEAWSDLENAFKRPMPPWFLP